MKNVLEAENFDMWDGGEKKKDEEDSQDGPSRPSPAER